MKAITLKDFGDADQFQVEELDIPGIKDDEVLVKVKAVSLNPIDTKTRSGKGLAGKLKEEKPLILGWDIAGIVTKTGKEVTGLREGDEVFGMVNFPGHGRAYAEYVASPEAHLALKPKKNSWEEAAAATLAALTAWQGMTQHTKIQKDQHVLVYGASGGVGHFAVQIACHLGAHVTGVSSAVNKKFILGLGAENHIDYQTDDLEKLSPEFDLVYDVMGGDAIDRTLKVIKPGGTIISITSGMNADVTEKASEKGINGLRTMVRSNGDDMQQLAELMEKDILKPHVSKVYNFSQMADAHRQIETRHTVGKIVVTV